MSDELPREVTLEEYMAMQKRAKQRSARARYVTRMSPEDRDAVTRSDAERKRHERSIMAPEDYDAYLAHRRATEKAKRDGETEAERDARRARDRERQQRSRAAKARALAEEDRIAALADDLLEHPGTDLT